MDDSLNLDGIRQTLIRQEDSIIFALLERSKYYYNVDTYKPDLFKIAGFGGSLVEYMVRETEKLHAKMGRYNSPDEHPFFPDHLPQPIVPRMDYPTSKALHPVADSININSKIWEMYFDSLLPILVRDGNDGNCGSTAVCDTICLRSMSKRVHYGKFVAEAKFRESPEVYEPAIKAQDENRLMELLTFHSVEESIKERVKMKAKTFGQDVNVEAGGGENTEPNFKIAPWLVADLYGHWIMPLTKEVQVQYLLRRLD